MVGIQCSDESLLFPMAQRYKFESKSQLRAKGTQGDASCFQWLKDTKFIHYSLIINIFFAISKVEKWIYWFYLHSEIAIFNVFDFYL